ncbi:MAG: signal peptidase II [Clostridiales bacterium]|jgi:signal peptidase II|nr:signal peptidase II [Clostridiales bacterium]
MRIFKRFVLPVIFIVAILGVDQFTKYWAATRLAPIGELVLIDGVFSLLYHENTGMAFGLFPDGRWVFVGLTVVAMGFFIYFYASLPRSRYHNVMRFFLLMLIGGALGNFVDRLIQGYVVDFFYFSLINFPIFNMADVFLVVSVIVLAIMILFVKEPKSG